MVRRVELKDYRQNVEKDAKPYLLLGRDVERGSGWVGLKEGDGNLIESALFIADTEQHEPDRSTISPLNLRLRYSRPDGFQVEKIFKFKPDSYIVEMDVVVTNGSAQPMTTRLYGGISQMQSKKADRYGFSGPSVLIDGKLKQIDIGDIEDQQDYLWENPMDRRSESLFSKCPGTRCGDRCGHGT